jgi:isopentenyl-diphosphate delta-isomerase
MLVRDTDSRPSGTTSKRKNEHLSIARDEAVEPSWQPDGPFWQVALEHQALPEIDFNEIDTSTIFLGRHLRLPLLIGSMTGGSAEAALVNQRLAAAAQAAGIGMCLGSQRAMIEDPGLTATYEVRDIAPDILLVANIGAVQLRRGMSTAQMEDAANRVGADAIVFHLNAAQEAVQSEGDTCFGYLTEALSEAVQRIGLPCGVKEVGGGFSRRSLELLDGADLAFIESAGRGGTSWPLIEALRAKDPISERVGRTFARWGIDAATSLNNCLKYGAHRPVLASGGVRNGLDIARTMALGASAAAMALPFLKAASLGAKECELEIACIDRELRTALFLTGSRDLRALRDSMP